MDVKRGRGGIREIEFTVTVLQVLYGSRHRALRVRPLLEALARLAHVGLISGNDPIKLAMNYGYLRRVEHRLQMEHGRQEHRLPPLGERRDTLALSLGLPDGDGLTEFMARVTEEVHAWYARFFEADRGASTEEDNDVALILSPVADPDQQAAALARRGFSNPHTATLLRSLALGTTEVFVSAAGQRAFEQLVPGLLRLSAGRPRPDQVIVHLHTLMHRLHSASYYYELLAAHPGVLRMVTFLFGTSDHLSEVLLACPEYFDRIIQGAVLDEADPERRRQSMLERIRSSMVAARTLEAQRRILRRAAEFEILTAYLAWLVNLATFEETLTALSDGADCVVQSALALAVKSVAQRHKMDDSSARELARTVEQRLLVVGLGKYGSRELNFRGDLDVIFVDLGEDAQNGLDGEGSVPLHEVAQEVSAILSEGSGIGRGHVLDTRLRPWGNDGPLISESSEWISYTRDQAAAWEFLSYQRMRLVAGPVKRGGELLEQIDAEVRRAVDHRIGRREFVEEVLSMRVRLEEQSSGGAGVEVKRSRGGIMDGEFALEAWLALGRPGWSELNRTHGRTGASGDEGQLAMGTRTHFAWWRDLESAGVGPDDAATVLGHTHRQLRLAENVARTVVGTSHSVLLPRESSEQAAAIWRNLAIVGLNDEVAFEGIQAAGHDAWKRWIAWLGDSV
jgi:glutamate-ammonia-ligase adenylyltransferase